MKLVLLSGGLDSALCYAHAGADALALFVDYSQPVAEQEREAARRVASGRRLYEVTVNGLSLGDMDGSNAGPQVVAARNAILLSLACNVAVEVGADEIVIGCNADDFRDYEDCRSQYLDALRDAFRPFGVRVSAPLLTLSKREIAKRASDLGISSTWSCYTPGDGPCGYCASCVANAA